MNNREIIQMHPFLSLPALHGQIFPHVDYSDGERMDSDPLDKILATMTFFLHREIAARNTQFDPRKIVGFGRASHDAWQAMLADFESFGFQDTMLRGVRWWRPTVGL